MRAGLLARHLAAAGHGVTWWTSTFDHTQKVHVFDTDTQLRLPDGVELRALRGLGYRRNVSLQRIRDHRKVAQAFAQQAERAPRPDVILASFPTIELAGAAVRFGARHGIPCVIDIRDLWPDLFSQQLPGWLRGLAAPAIALLRAQASRVCSEAFGIIGNAPSFVEWGLRLAGRTARPSDRHVPFAYALPAIPDVRLAEARRYWNERGIRHDGDQVVGVYFGAIGHQSDFTGLIEAASLLSHRGVKFRLVICGTGERYEELRARASENPDVLLPGWIGQPEIRALMEAAHFGIAPYWNSVGFVDNLPNKPIEYMAGGLPVVTCLTGYLREFIERNGCGFYYPQGDVQALAELIASLCADRSRLQDAADNARRAYRENFDADLVHRTLTEYLESIARNSRGNAA